MELWYVKLVKWYYPITNVFFYCNSRSNNIFFALIDNTCLQPIINILSLFYIEKACHELSDKSSYKIRVVKR